MGLYPWWWSATLEFATPVRGSMYGEKKVLFAQIFASLGINEVIVENDVLFPAGWRHPAANISCPMGQQPGGRTICLHSIAVCAPYTKHGAGSLLLKRFLRNVSAAGIADRVAVLCSDVRRIVCQLCLWYLTFGSRKEWIGFCLLVS